MDDETLIGGLISRLLAKRPDLWAAFQTDPLGALEEARITPSADERTALDRVEAAAQAQRRSTAAKPDPLAEAFKADLAAARAARALDFNPLAEEKPTEEATQVEEGLLGEQQRLKKQADAMRASLADERERLAREKAEAIRKLGGGKKH